MLRCIKIPEIPAALLPLCSSGFFLLSPFTTRIEKATEG